MENHLILICSKVLLQNGDARCVSSCINDGIRQCGMRWEERRCRHINCSGLSTLNLHCLRFIQICAFDLFCYFPCADLQAGNNLIYLVGYLNVFCKGVSFLLFITMWLALACNGHKLARCTPPYRLPCLIWHGRIFCKGVLLILDMSFKDCLLL